MSDNDTKTRTHEDFIVRRKTFQDLVTTVGGVTAILSAIAMGALYLLGILPFVKQDVYANDRSTDRAEVFVLQSQQRVQAVDIAEIKRNGLLTIQLQIMARIDSLSASAASAQRAGQSTYAVQNEINALRQNLEEINRQLAR